MHATKCATLVLDWFTACKLRGLEQSSHILELQEAVRDYECNSRLLLTSLMWHPTNPSLSSFVNNWMACSVPGQYPSRQPGTSMGCPPPLPPHSAWQLSIGSVPVVLTGGAARLPGSLCSHYSTHPICLSAWYSLPSLSTVWDSVSVVSSVVPSVLLGLVPLLLKPPRPPPAPDILSLLWDLLWPRALLEAGVPLSLSTLCLAGEG